MDGSVRGDLYHGLFRLHALDDGRVRLLRNHPSPPTIPDPRTGIHLRVATVEAGATTICPACASRSEGGFVSFVADLRLAYACPACQKLIWIRGA